MMKKLAVFFLVYPAYIIIALIGGFILFGVESQIVMQIPYFAQFQGKVLTIPQLRLFDFFFFILPKFIVICLVDLPFKKANLLVKIALTLCAFGLEYYFWTSI